MNDASKEKLQQVCTNTIEAFDCLRMAEKAPDDVAMVGEIVNTIHKFNAAVDLMNEIVLSVKSGAPSQPSTITTQPSTGFKVNWGANP